MLYEKIVDSVSLTKANLYINHPSKRLRFQFLIKTVFMISLKDNFKSLFSSPLNNVKINKLKVINFATSYQRRLCLEMMDVNIKLYVG